MQQQPQQQSTTRPDAGTQRHRGLAPVEVLACALAGVLMLSSMGCGFTGESGNMRFFYETAEFSPKRSVAVDATVQINAYENVDDSASDEHAIDISNVTSSDPGVLSVSSAGAINKNSFRLTANAPGSADINIEGVTQDGSNISDSFTLSAESVASVQFEHACDTGSTSPVYLTDQTHVVEMELLSSSGERLVGWGYNPVTVNGPGSGYGVDTSVKQSDKLGIAFGSQTGTVTVESTLGSESISMDAVAESSIDEMSWFGGSNGTPELHNVDSDEGLLYAQFKSGGRVACNGRVALDYDVQTSDVCSVSTDYLSPGTNLLTEIGQTQTGVKVTEKKAGTCRFDVSVSQASSSVSKSVQLDLSEDV